MLNKDGDVVRNHGKARTRLENPGNAKLLATYNASIESLVVRFHFEVCGMRVPRKMCQNPNESGFGNLKAHRIAVLNEGCKVQGPKSLTSEGGKNSTGPILMAIRLAATWGLH